MKHYRLHIDGERLWADYLARLERAVALGFKPTVEVIAEARHLIEQHAREKCLEAYRHIRG